MYTVSLCNSYELLMKDYPLISVLVPAFNHENFIEATLNSIVADTYPNKELIIIDDGSDDQTPEIINKWKMKHQSDINIILTSRKNKGVTPTFNDLIDLSSGEFLTFIHSDDYLLPDGLLKRMQFLTSNPDRKAVFGDCKVVDQHNNLLFESGLSGLYPTNKEKYKSNKSLKKEIITNWSVPGGTLLVKKEVYQNFRYNEEYIVEDLDFFLKLCAKDELGFLDEKVSVYRFHGNNTCYKKENFFRVNTALIKSLYRNAKLFDFTYWFWIGVKIIIILQKMLFQKIKIILKNGM